ncbi:MAG: hypothetical protein HQK86_07675 [Nitrospinae bacterium]|nr:hypothetical protein [Nitrospinota bacterium]MBF0633321.1 hypothetical protein [Nitrospinota bacterium]
MSLINELDEVFRFGLRQFTGFLEILKLKIRIIGFSNKRSGVLTKLGEMTHKAVVEGRLDPGDDVIRKFSSEARTAELEISSAEESINAKREALKEDMTIFKSRFKDDDDSSAEAGRSVNSGKGPGVGA